MDEKLSTLNSQSLIFRNDNDVEKLEKDHLLNENEIYKSDFIAKLIEQNKLLMQENTSLKQAFGISHTNKELLCKGKKKFIIRMHFYYNNLLLLFFIIFTSKFVFFFFVYVEQNVDCPLPATTMSKKSPIDSNVECLAWNKDDFINSGIPRTSPVNSYENFGDLDALLPLGT